ncbi:MAG: flagellar hook capping FlgD N-terminal domain-containing protein [Planctomycetota bacterium]|nr:flagellar hook capping FlgD N-terminal domain-containing protein [Planctomycetota bacterium]
MSAISGFTSAQTRDAQSNPYETLTSEDFIRVMFAELTRQDPTKPTESKDLLEQIGTIRSIESDVSLTKRLEEISKQNEIASAGSLVGKFAEGKTDSGITANGFIDSVSVTRTGMVLNLSTGVSVPLSRLERIVDPALISGTPPPPADDDDPAEEPGTDDPTGGTDDPTNTPTTPAPQPGTPAPNAGWEGEI